MKLATLLAQYLYTHKRLDLPGLGSFLLDPFAANVSEQDNTGAQDGLSFENNASIKVSSDLVAYISSETGKIKALAAADLDSYLEQARQFLNIGKPFLFEGIGNLAKIRSGEFTFTAGQIMPEMIKDISQKDTPGAIPTEESKIDYKTIFYPHKEKIGWRKPAAALLVFAGIGLAVWGGYKMYKKTTAKNDEITAVDEKVIPPTPVEEKKAEPVAAVVDEPVLNQRDSVIEQPQAVTTVSNYKYILETNNAKRAFSRFNRLKSFDWNVQMETTDSLSYKIFLLLPAPADTSRILDSLTRLNGKRVYIE